MPGPVIHGQALAGRAGDLGPLVWSPMCQTDGCIQWHLRLLNLESRFVALLFQAVIARSPERKLTDAPRRRMCNNHFFGRTTSDFCGKIETIRNDRNDMDRTEVDSMRYGRTSHYARLNGSRSGPRARVLPRCSLGGDTWALCRPLTWACLANSLFFSLCWFAK